MSDSDLAGRSRIGKNAVAGWLTYVVFIVFGFVMPRAIDEAVGQAALGVWDFAWSIVHYMSISMIGIGSSVNRYVARYRSQHDNESLSKTMSSVNAIQIAIGAAVCLVSVGLSFYIPVAMASQLGEQAEAAGSLVLFLGMALAVQMAFDVYRGILTGCHKWVIYNGLNAGGYAIAASGMVLSLLYGGGLRDMAIIYLVVTVATEIARAYIARKACPEIVFSMANVNIADSKKMVRFGLKTILIGLPRMITVQTVSIFVVANLGVVTLAVLARPLALISHIAALIRKYGSVLTPTAGALQGSGRTEELREFALSSMRVGWFLTVLPVVFLAVMGDKIIYLWMGPGYESWAVIIILSCGAMVSASQIALLNIMIGMNEHGRIAKLCLINSVSVLFVGSIVVHYVGWSLIAAATLTTLPAIAGTGFVIPYIGCRKLSISAGEYMKDVIRDPLILLLATVPALIAVRYVGPEAVFPSLFVGMIVHVSVAAVVLRKDLRVAYEKIRRPKVA